MRVRGAGVGARRRSGRVPRGGSRRARRPSRAGARGSERRECRGAFTLDPVAAAGELAACLGVARHERAGPLRAVRAGRLAGSSCWTRAPSLGSRSRSPCWCSRLADGRGSASLPSRRFWSIAVSRVPWRIVARGLVPILWLLVFTLVVNAFLWRPDVGAAGGRADRHLGSRARTRPLLRLPDRASVLGTSVVTLTTSPVALTDALTQLMRPLRAMCACPWTTSRRCSRSRFASSPLPPRRPRRSSSRRRRGARRSTRAGRSSGARAWVPVLVPLFVNLFRRADDLAIAMESRCYTGQGRTRLHEPSMRVSDWVALVVGVTAARCRRDTAVMSEPSSHTSC